MSSSVYESKASMLERGIRLAQTFCEINNMVMPNVVSVEREHWRFKECAYYRLAKINICVAKCAAVGYAGMSWSFPGHSVDRTPYGVIAHELGHHADMLLSTVKNKYRGNFSIALRKECGEERLTSYCPDDGEWFAEMFRLFVTNPDLLSKLRPKTHSALTQRFKPVFSDTWQERLRGAPERTVLSIERKLAK